MYLILLHATLLNDIILNKVVWMIKYVARGYDVMYLCTYKHSRVFLLQSMTIQWMDIR